MFPVIPNNARPETAKARISNPVSGGQCHLVHLTFLRGFSSNKQINLLTAKLFNLNFHPLEIVSRWRDPQLQVSENY